MRGSASGRGDRHTRDRREVDADDLVVFFYLTHPVGSHLAEAQVWRNVSGGGREATAGTTAGRRGAGDSGSHTHDGDGAVWPLEISKPMQGDNREEGSATTSPEGTANHQHQGDSVGVLPNTEAFGGELVSRGVMRKTIGLSRGLLLSIIASCHDDGLAQEDSKAKRQGWMSSSEFERTRRRGCQTNTVADGGVKNDDVAAEAT